MLISLKSLSASDVWHQSFLLLEEELLMPRCCAVGSVLAELPVLCKNLSLPKKDPSFLLRYCTQPGTCGQVEDVRAEEVLGEL